LGLGNFIDGKKKKTACNMLIINPTKPVYSSNSKIFSKKADVIMIILYIYIYKIILKKD
jgi:hypothetical protein